MIRNTLTTVVAALFSLNIFAQIDVDIDLGKPEWYENPYLWAGVVALLILVLVLTRRKAK